ncbi:MAG: hypothetical protein ACFB0B_18880 [Thermonemataceae bacterium]
MDKNIEFKKKVVEVATQKKAELLDTIIKREKEEIDQASKMSEAGNENWRESREEEVIERADMIAHRAEDVEKDLQTLKTIIVDTPHEQVQFGSLVLTSDQYWLIGASLQAFQVDDNKVIGVSMEAPVFQQLKGKTKGDTIQLGEQTVTIDGVI